MLKNSSNAVENTTVCLGKDDLIETLCILTLLHSEWLKLHGWSFSHSECNRVKQYFSYIWTVVG